MDSVPRTRPRLAPPTDRDLPTGGERRQPPAELGQLLRQWRARRHLSQLEVSSQTGVSTRHLSCVETGRARSSRELVLHLARALEVPLREQNRLLLAAGYAPVYDERPLDDAAMTAVADVLDDVLRCSDPNPAVVMDRHWNLQLANEAALWLCTGVAGWLLEPPVNVARLSLHPDGLAPRVRNFDRYAAHLVDRLQRTAELTGDSALVALLDEVSHLVPSESPPLPDGDGPVFALALEITVEGRDLSLFSTVATFGTAVDITLDELAIETFYPADPATAEVLASRPWR
ncbi:MAG: helix-turn-helix transcriptional regulator [Acidimicrobiia bacterium]|nr:helix-turn-helix transcriptional regulator [Acidimicrobiia bacterium]